MNTKKATFKAGDVVRFKSNNISYGLIESGGCPDAKAHDGKIATIEHLQTFTELGNKNAEYYTIQFEDGMIWWGISGYHLSPVNENRVKLLKSAIIFLFILLFAMIGESIIEWFLNYINNLNP